MPTVAATETAGHVKQRVAIIGVVVQDRFSFPVKISINVGDIGGPSAGMMFALGIIQILERHDLTHGCIVAGTGTIDSSGNVGPIGGAKQKIIAARRAGARYFLVPDTPDNVGPARSARGGVEVVPVKTLRQALGFLQRLKPCR
jgi:PDZ domain-containing protein